MYVCISDQSYHTVPAGTRMEQINFKQNVEIQLQRILLNDSHESIQIQQIKILFVGFEVRVPNLFLLLLNSRS